MHTKKIDGFLSVVIDLNSTMDVEELIFLVQKIIADKNAFEIICITGKQEIFENPDLINLISNSPNIASYFLTAGASEDLKSYGLELSLGDYIIELYSPGNRLQDYETLIENFITEGKVVQLLPQKITIKDKIISAIASKALQNDIKSLTLLARISTREALSVWNRRKMKHKVFKLATQLAFEITNYIPVDRKKSESEKRFIRIGLRTVIHASAAPLRWVALSSILGAGISLGVSIFVVLLGLARSSVEGWATTNLQISIYASLAFTAISFMSEYLYQIFENLNETPNIRLVSERISTEYRFIREPNIENLKTDKANG
jgi:hypothetical protein